MTLDETITLIEEKAEENKESYRLCPSSESEIFHCDGIKDCKALENGKNKGCLKCAKELLQLAEWLKELKQLRIDKWIPVVSGKLPKEKETVIASTKYAVYPEARHTKEDGWQWSYDSITDHWVKLKDVEAWVPLPKRYIAESEEQIMSIYGDDKNDLQKNDMYDVIKRFLEEHSVSELLRIIADVVEYEVENK